MVAPLGPDESAPRATIAENALVAERFRLIRLIGKGGMGSVWEAHHVALDVPCAVKFITCEGHDRETLLRRFEREAKAAAGISGRHVVQIFDYGVWNGLPYIAMELMKGEDLRTRLKRVMVLPPEDVLRIARHVARALRKAHERGIVHRDLKPDNIFLVYDDDGTQKNDAEVAKVLDFGIAKSVGIPVASETTTGELLGTPVYMSPEQIRGTRRVDERSDLWSLAVIVYRCLLGKLPFVAGAFGDLVLEICSKPIVVPSSVGAVPAGFDEWWQKAVARRPRDRFQTAAEFTAELERVLAPRGAAPSVPSSQELVMTAPPVESAVVPIVAEEAATTTREGMVAIPFVYGWRRLALAGGAALLMGTGALAAHLRGRAEPPPASAHAPATVVVPAPEPAPAPPPTPEATASAVEIPTPAPASASAAPSEAPRPARRPPASRTPSRTGL
ncbi:serine/threonine-protein kinase [Pendulispora brunnea]|uniref:serine/threonine-protein kinase n=1 Tax=Pendulispora brunnea TaxID=2905690 RepID=UPI00374E1162